MSKEAQSHELTYDLIKRAVHGDQQAIEAYLLHYDAYINSLVMYDEVGSDGQLHSYIDEDMKIQVQMKIVDAFSVRLLFACHLFFLLFDHFLDSTPGGIRPFMPALTGIKRRTPCWNGISGALRTSCRRCSGTSPRCRRSPATI